MLRFGQTWLGVIMLATLPFSIDAAAGVDLNSPTALACDHAGNLFAGVPLKHSIFKYELGGGKSDFATGITTYALAVDKVGNVYVSDTGPTIFKFTPTGVKSDFAEVTASPRSFAFDASGNLFVVESFSGAISKFAPDGTHSVFLAGRPAPEPEEEAESEESETDSS